MCGAFPLPHVPARVTRGALVAHRHSFAPSRWEFLSIAGPLCATQYLLRDLTMLMTAYLMVWDWKVLRAEQMHSWSNTLLLFVPHYFIVFFQPWFGCVGLGPSD